MSDNGKIMFYCKGDAIGKFKIFLNLINHSVEYYSLGQLSERNTLKEVLEEINNSPELFFKKIPEDSYVGGEVIFAHLKKGDRIIDLNIVHTSEYKEGFIIALGFSVFKFEYDRGDVFLKHIFGYIPKMIETLRPEIIYGIGSELCESSYEYFFQYFRDPVLFASFQDGDQFTHNKISKFISAEEIKKIFVNNRNGFEVILPKKAGGIGVVKSYSLHRTSDDNKLFTVYPHYFIRKELKKRGLKIENGLPEKYAKELGIKDKK